MIKYRLALFIASVVIPGYFSSATAASCQLAKDWNSADFMTLSPLEADTTRITTEGKNTYFEIEPNTQKDKVYYDPDGKPQLTLVAFFSSFQTGKGSYRLKYKAAASKNGTVFVAQRATDDRAGQIFYRKRFVSGKKFSDDVKLDLPDGGVDFVISFTTREKSWVKVEPITLCFD